MGQTLQNPAEGRYPIAAASVFLLLAGVLIPSPLYELYRKAFGLTPAQIGLVFAIYAASLIPSLIFLGGISDHIGRRRTMLTGIALLALGSLVFAFANEFVWLIIGRILQGFAVGVGLGASIAAITEWMPEAMRKHAGQVAVIATSAGAAFGALLAGALGQYTPYGASLPYFVHIALLIVLAFAIASVPSCPHVYDSNHSSVLHVPKSIRRPFYIAAGQAFISWGTLGVFLSLVPTFLDNALHLDNLMIGAGVVSLVQTGAIVASLTTDRFTNRTGIVTAMLVLGAGMWCLLLSKPWHLQALIFVGAFLAGAGNGISYAIALRIVGAISPPEHRAEVTSSLLVAGYTGFSLPVLLVGFVADYVGLYLAFLAAAVALGAIALTTVAVATDRNLAAPT